MRYLTIFNGRGRGLAKTPPLLHRAALKKFPAGVFRKNTFICCGLGMKPTPLQN